MPMLNYEGGEYEFEFENVTLPEYRQIKAKLGMTIRQFIEATEQLDPDAITALRWVVLRSDGKHDDLPLDPAAEFDVFGFLEPWAEYEKAKAALKAADPTKAGSPPATPTPASNGSSTLTSASSPASTSSGSPGIAESVNGKSAVSPSAVSSAT